MNTRITCEIKLFEHLDSAYKPGDKAHGIVKYVLNEDTLFSGITISLKGLGHLRIKKGREADFFEEVFADIDDVILENNDIPIPAGTHEVPFEFVIPENVPPSFKYFKNKVTFSVKYEVFYYIRIKFERRGILKLDKRFKTNLHVVSSVKPTLPASAATHELRKTPFQLSHKKDKLISIKFIVENPVTTPGGNLNINYVIDNESELNIKRIKMMLTQETTFKRPCHHDINDKETLAVYSASAIKAGDGQSKDFVMEIPSNVMPLQNSKYVSRNYFVTVVVELPFPHWDAVMKIPVEVYCCLEDVVEAAPLYEPPPSYSEVMAEYKKENNQQI